MFAHATIYLYSRAFFYLNRDSFGTFCFIHALNPTLTHSFIGLFTLLLFHSSIHYSTLKCFIHFCFIDSMHLNFHSTLYNATVLSYTFHSPLTSSFSSISSQYFSFSRPHFPIVPPSLLIIFFLCLVCLFICPFQHEYAFLLFFFECVKWRAGVRLTPW